MRNRNYCYRSSLLDTGATCATLYEETTKGRTSEESRQQTADSRKQKAVYIQAYVQEYIQTDFKPTDHFTRQPELYAFVFPKMTVFIHSINFPIPQSIPSRHSQLLYETYLTQPANPPTLEHISSIISISIPISLPTPTPTPSPFPSPSNLHPHFLPHLLHLLPPSPSPSPPSPLISIPQKKTKLTKQSNLPATSFTLHSTLPNPSSSFLYPIRPSTIYTQERHHPTIVTTPLHHRHHA